MRPRVKVRRLLDEDDGPLGLGHHAADHAGGFQLREQAGDGVRGHRQQQAARGLRIVEERPEGFVGVAAVEDFRLEGAAVRLEPAWLERERQLARPGQQRQLGERETRGSRGSRGRGSSAWPIKPKPVTSVAAPHAQAQGRGRGERG